MLIVKRSNRFDKSLRLSIRRGEKPEQLEALVELLQLGKPLPARCKDHPLIGNYNGMREFKIRPDWLVVYRIENKVLYLIDTGTHSDLFT